MSETIVAAETQTLLISNDHGVRTIVLNRPEKLNALNTELTASLKDALLAADSDPNVRAIVLSGAGRGFCAGADLSEFSTFTPEHQEQVATRAALTAQTQKLPQEISKPVIAAIWGPAVGGGAGLALACDMVIAGENTKFGYPELKHSIVPALVMTGLQRHFPRKVAFELISTGRMLSAAELLEFNVINQMLPQAEVLSAAQEIAKVWAKATPAAMQAVKSLYYRVADLPFDAAMRAGQDINTIMRGFRS